MTKRQPTAEEWTALRFAWRVCAHVKSNTVIFTGADRTLAVGAGQMSRVDAVKVAVMKAAPGALAGSVAASDAFFPFRDGLDALADAGATAVVQPGGSVRDAEVIAAADERGLAMVFTGRTAFQALTGECPSSAVHRSGGSTRLRSLQRAAASSGDSCRPFWLLRRVLPYFVDLGDSAIWDANEAFYVETPREMIERGDYVSPDLQLRAALQQAGPELLDRRRLLPAVRRVGRRAAACRSRSARIGLIATAFLLGWLRLVRLRAVRGAPRSEAALWAALGLAVSPRLLMFARRIFIDIYISLFMALTLLFFAAAERYPERRRLFLLLM